MRLVNTRCAICDSAEDYTVIYEKNFTDSNFTPDIFSARRLPDRVHYRIVRCNKDGLIRSNPVLDEASAYDLYKKSGFTYEDETETLAASYLSVLKPILHDLPNDAKIMEIGCGNGFLLKALYDMGYKNVFGIEPSADAIEKADKIIRNRIVADILHSIAFAPNSFGLICSFQLLDHIQDPNDLLKRCRTLLSPGGSVVALVHDTESLQAKLLKERSPIIDIEHLYLFSKETIKKIFIKNNFVPIKTYSPRSIVSLRHLIRLAPIPDRIKIALLNIRWLRPILRKRIRMNLGNVCLIAAKKGI